MKAGRADCVLRCLLVASLWAGMSPSSSWAQSSPSFDHALAGQAGGNLGADVDGLLEYARTHNPDYAAWQAELQASAERSRVAGRWADPKLRLEWMDVTRMGAQNPSLLPGRVGSARYLFMQDISWLGKNDLKHDVAQAEAAGARSRTQDAWAELAAQIKTAVARRYYLHHSLQLNREMLALMGRLEQIARTRYASGLAAQQDVIRAQLEQTRLRSELIELEMQRHHEDAQLNALLARPVHALLQEPVRLPALPGAASLDAGLLEARLRQQSPQLQMWDAEVQTAEKNRILAEKNRYPDFTVGFAPVQTQNAVRQWDVMFEMNIPLQQEIRRAQENEAEARLAATRHRQEAATHRLLARLAEVLSALDAARHTLKLMNDDLLPQAELTYQAALAGYEAGRLDFATLLEAQRQIRQGRLSRLKAEVDVCVQVAQIERLLGGAL